MHKAVGGTLAVAAGAVVAAVVLGRDSTPGRAVRHGLRTLGKRAR